MFSAVWLYPSLSMFLTNLNIAFICAAIAKSPMFFADCAGLVVDKLSVWPTVVKVTANVVIICSIGWLCNVAALRPKSLAKSCTWLANEGSTVVFIEKSFASSCGLAVWTSML